MDLLSRLVNEATQSERTPSADRVLDALRHAMPVQIQNVAEYPYEPDDLALKWEKDFPNTQFTAPGVSVICSSHLNRNFDCH
jgi:hypothetical protein